MKRLFYFLIKVWNLVKNFCSYVISISLKKVVLWGDPSFLSFELSSVCNLSCPQCPAGKKEIERNSNYLDLDAYTKIIDSCGVKLLTAILYFQGEPLLNKNFCSYVEYAKKYNIYCQTSTNAQILNRKMAEEIVKSKLDKIIISIDGTTQDTYTKYRIGGDINKAINSIKLLSKTKNELKSKTPIIEVQMIVFAFNEHQIDEFKFKAVEWGANKITIKSAQIYSPELNCDLIPKNEKYSRYHLKDGTYLNKLNKKRACFRAWSGGVVSVDKMFLPCCFDKNQTFSYSYINDDVDKIWRSEKAMIFRSSLIKHKNSFDICQNCDS